MKIKSHLIAIGLTLLSGLISWVDAKEVKLTSNPTSPKATFALGDITKQLTTKGHQVKALPFANKLKTTSQKLQSLVLTKLV